MLRIITSASVGQAKKYYSEGLTREGYYADGQEMAGQWGGRGAVFLGLKGDVGKAEFDRLCENQHPFTGARLTQRNMQNRRVGYDFNFSPPKSYSIAYFMFKERRADLLAAYRESVNLTMLDVEKDAATRVMGGREGDRITSNFCWAEYVHFTGRPVDGMPDPQVHSHIFVFNATLDPVDTKWKAGQFGDIKRDANYYQGLFRMRLAERLRGLGFEIVKTENGFEIAGISRPLVKKFSRRSEVIEKKAQELGITSAAAKDKLAAMTREKKVKGMSLTELESHFRARLTNLELEELSRLEKSLPPLKSTVAEATAIKSREWLGELKAIRPRPERATAAADDHESLMSGMSAVRFAVRHLFERQSSVTERELTQEAVKWGYADSTLEAIQKAVKEYPLIRIQKDGQLLLTTTEVLLEEDRIIKSCMDGLGRFGALNPSWAIKDQILNDQQRNAVFHVLNSRDFITGISGKAGTGKTTLLHEAKKAIEASGKTLLVLAPTAEAARGVLRGQGFKDADTVARLLNSFQLAEKANGAVIWVDEAGLLSNRSMDRLIGFAREHGARLVLVGDVGQHHAVERGQGFDLLQKFGGMDVSEVNQVQRQSGLYRQAVELISEGRLPEAFAVLEKMGAFRELPFQKRGKALAEDYVSQIEAGKKTLVVCPTNAECADVTSAIRSILKSKKAIVNERPYEILRNLSWTAAQKSDARQYQIGQVVQFNQSHKGFSLGEQLQVQETGVNGVTVRNSNGKISSLPLPRNDREAERFSVYEPDLIKIGRGDKVRITANSRTVDGHRLNNRDTYKVKGFTKEGQMVLDNGWHLKSDFKHVEHGYASTSHSSQGKTVDVVLISQSGLYSSGASDARQFYVSVTRGCEDIHIYTDSIAGLKEDVVPVKERPMASELIEELEKNEAEREMEKEAAYATQKEPEPVLEMEMELEL